MAKDLTKNHVTSALTKKYLSKKNVDGLADALKAVQIVQKINGEGYISLYGTTPIMEELVNLGMLKGSVKNVSQNYSVVIYKTRQ